MKESSASTLPLLLKYFKEEAAVLGPLMSCLTLEANMPHSNRIIIEEAVCSKLSGTTTCHKAKSLAKQSGGTEIHLVQSCKQDLV